MMDIPVLKSTSLCLSLPNVHLREFSFELCAGQIAAVIGSNGAGKSTLVKALAGDFDRELTPSKIQGQLQYSGGALFGSRPHSISQRVAVMSQHSRLSFPFMVREVVALGRLPHATGKQADKAIVEMVIQAMALEGLAERAYTSLSGGEQQRVHFARALAQICQAESNDLTRQDFSGCLLILDEPFSAQDLKYQALLKNWLQTLRQRGLAVLVVLHDVNMAAQLADKVMGLKNGAMQFFGDAKKVLTTTQLNALYDIEMTCIEHRGQQIFTMSH